MEKTTQNLVKNYTIITKTTNQIKKIQTLCSEEFSFTINCYTQDS